MSTEQNQNNKVEGDQETLVNIDDASPTETTRKTPAKRTFTVVEITRNDKEIAEEKGGKFQSKTPAGAARKAANQVCKKLWGEEDDITVDICIEEVKKQRGGKKNEDKKEKKKEPYKYRAHRTLNTKDVDFKNSKGDAIAIGFKYAMNLKSLKKTAAGKVVEEATVIEPEEVAK